VGGSTCPASCCSPPPHCPAALADRGPVAKVPVADLAAARCRGRAGRCHLPGGAARRAAAAATVAAAPAVDVRGLPMVFAFSMGFGAFMFVFALTVQNGSAPTPCVAAWRSCRWPCCSPACSAASSPTYPPTSAASAAGADHPAAERPRPRRSQPRHPLPGAGATQHHTPSRTGSPPSGTCR